MIDHNTTTNQRSSKLINIRRHKVFVTFSNSYYPNVKNINFVEQVSLHLIKFLFIKNNDDDHKFFPHIGTKNAHNHYHGVYRLLATNTIVQYINIF